VGMRLPLPLCMTVWGRVAEQAWVERPQFPHPPPPFQGWGFRLCGVMHWRNTARPNFEMGGAGVRRRWAHHVSEARLMRHPPTSTDPGCWTQDPDGEVE